MSRRPTWITAHLASDHLAAQEPWRLRAACANHPRLLPAAWDDSPTGREDADTRARRIAAAKAVCRAECPVRRECLHDVDWDRDEGVRGGEDLRVLRARRNRRPTHSPDTARTA